MEKCFSLEEIKLAVDITIGDDGMQDEQAQNYKEKRTDAFL